MTSRTAHIAVSIMLIITGFAIGQGVGAAVIRHQWQTATVWLFVATVTAVTGLFYATLRGNLKLREVLQDLQSAIDMPDGLKRERVLARVFAGSDAPRVPRASS